MTFGCFNNASRVGIPVPDAWVEVMCRAEGSRLMPKDRRFEFGVAGDIWKNRLMRRGITGDRFELRGASPRAECLNAYNDLDIP